jgi:tetratricopeptide (TPR) repeat protein
MSVALAALVLLAQLRAETIYLKNGRTILAESVTETGDKVYYEGEFGRVSIPKSMVDRIEKGGVLPPRRTPITQPPPDAAPQKEELPPAIRLSIDVSQMQNIMRDGAVDDRKLAELASQARAGERERRTALNALLLAAVVEARDQRLAEAARWAEEALRVDSYDHNALLLAAQIALTRRQYSDALRHMLIAHGNEPENPDVLTMLGDAYYFTQGAERALRYWKQADAIRPDPKLRDRIVRAEREAELERELEQAESYHFVLSWEGSAADASFGEQVLESLETSYRELEVALDYSPREQVSVILYGSQQFSDITRSPGWAGAANDGKIRVPVQGLSSLSPELAQILKHEMVHSFIHQIAEGRCPTWLNEGIAQMLAGESLDEFGALIASRYAASRQMPLAQLEGSFRRFNTAQALLAYAQSLAAVEMIRDEYGDYQLPALLKALRSGQSITDAFRSVLRVSYGEFEEQMAAYLSRRYPAVVASAPLAKQRNLFQPRGFIPLGPSIEWPL